MTVNSFKFSYLPGSLFHLLNWFYLSDLPSLLQPYAAREVEEFAKTLN